MTSREAIGVILATVAIGAVPAAQGPNLPEITPTAGIVIDRSVRLKPGAYRLSSRDLDTPALVVRGSNVTLDLTGVTLEGGDPYDDPDHYTGLGVLVDGGRGVTIRGGTIRGYKVGVLARRANGLHITGGDFSYNWKPRLWSGIEHESLVDWLTYHHNEKGEWLRYGAAIYLADSNDIEIDNTRAVQGQNGLLITKSARAKIWNNTFSWMSGLGIGLYRTTDSRLMHNRLDYDVRGYSHGFYNRGQDSAGLLMFEQTSNNVVAYNSITHGGDGVFLWAGQSTMDTGQGGANDNTFYGNDLSHAVANGIEATFSRNQIYNNWITDCWHGVWGGYSYQTKIEGNTFVDNTEGIAIEHGQAISIKGNGFLRDETAIRLWASATQDPSWGYPKFRDTESRDYFIYDNTFEVTKTALNVARTSGVYFGQQRTKGVGTLVQKGPDVALHENEYPPAAQILERMAPVPERLRGGTNAMAPDGAPHGRKTIIVDDWGPYDYQSPKVWPAGKLTDRPLTLRVLGPAGKWTLTSIAGGTAETRAGEVPGQLLVTPSGGSLDIALDYVGAEVVTPRGEKYAAGAHVPVTYTLVDPDIDWSVKWWTFDAAADPVKAPDAFAVRLRETPALAERLPHLDFVTSGSIRPSLPRDRVALRAEGTVTLPTPLDLVVISDDGVRVWVDDRLAIDRWTVHQSTLDRLSLSSGPHRLRVEYFEHTGSAELQVRFAATPPRTAGASEPRNH